MSADNWRRCPKCMRKEHNRQQAAAKKADELYGKVTPGEYQKLLASKEPRELDCNLREDYGIGIDSDGQFFAHYVASCQVCDFEFTYKHEVKVLK